MTVRAAAGRFPADLYPDRMVVVRDPGDLGVRPSTVRHGRVVPGARRVIVRRGQADLAASRSVARLAPRRLAPCRLTVVPTQTFPP
jgi:hypothetical protein